ncbi:C-GCAxxG-C-C family protein [Anaerovorax odorimutans]|uniref:C-GCAxxG-C-C family protein n=1 Tax=Anaerovorax odorimutans TaxID=109327 RepID=A0ABT1RKI4_9FIRM|nr:C-GCAxxG-C-C family protein [Anaerovorax odorimutans]MCQ4635678.1 C-GCAxxG-C-C family protein [Anaerovorax odorimutans]
MSERVTKAVENHRKGYNCAQAVVCAYCDLMGVDEKEAFKMSEAFGFGMGTMGTCGAVSAMAVLTGMKLSDGNLDKPATKKQCYKAMKEMIKKFEEKNKSVICAELKGINGGNVLRSCDGCVEDAARIVEEVLVK